MGGFGSGALQMKWVQISGENAKSCLNKPLTVQLVSSCGWSIICNRTGWCVDVSLASCDYGTGLMWFLWCVSAALHHVPACWAPNLISRQLTVHNRATKDVCASHSTHRCMQSSNVRIPLMMFADKDSKALGDERKKTLKWNVESIFFKESSVEFPKTLNGQFVHLTTAESVSEDRVKWSRTIQWCDASGRELEMFC